MMPKTAICELPLRSVRYCYRREYPCRGANPKYYPEPGGSGFFRPYWSGQILDEFERYCAHRTGNADIAKRQRARIRSAFPEAMITELDDIAKGGLTLPDPDDRHVLAAAIKARAERIITENLKDFPVDVLKRHGIEVLSLDNFVADILDLAAPEAVAALRTMRRRFNKPDITADDLILKIEKLGLVATANVLTAYRHLL